MWKLPDKSLLCKISCVIPPTKPQISRSAPPLLHPSKKLTAFLNIFCAATNWKKRIHENAGDELQTMAIFLNANDRNSKFERDSRLSGWRVRGTGERQAQKSPTGEVGLFCFLVLSWWLWPEEVTFQLTILWYSLWGINATWLHTGIWYNRSVSSVLCLSCPPP